MQYTFFFNIYLNECLKLIFYLLLTLIVQLWSVMCLLMHHLIVAVGIHDGP